MTDIVLSKRALADFKAIWLYIAADNEAAADKLLLAIDEKIEQLREFPKLGTMRDDIRAGARMLVHGNYIALYDFNEEADIVTIIAVVHGARDLNSVL